MADKYYNDHCQKVLGIIHHGLSTAANGLLTIVQATIDLAYTVGILSQYSAMPGKSHVHALYRAFRYLRATAHHTLVFHGNGSGEVIGFVDADWAANINDRRSISGYVFMLSDGAISWSSKKQGSTALSSTEAEYIAAAHAAKEAIWLRTLLSELRQLVDRPTTLLIDNQSAIAIAKNPAFHARTKHIDVCYHFLWEKYTSGELELEYVPTGEQIADVLTKGLSRQKHELFCSSMGVHWRTS